MRVQLSERAGDGRCAFCHDGGDDLVECGMNCGGRAHADCWKGLQRCPTIGCTGVLVQDTVTVLRPGQFRHPRMLELIAERDEETRRRVIELEANGRRAEAENREANRRAEVLLRFVFALVTTTGLWFIGREILTSPPLDPPAKRDRLPEIDRALRVGEGSTAGSVLTFGTGTQGTWSEPAVGTTSPGNHAAWDGCDVVVELEAVTVTPETALADVGPLVSRRADLSIVAREGDEMQTLTATCAWSIIEKRGVVSAFGGEAGLPVCACSRGTIRAEAQAFVVGLQAFLRVRVVSSLAHPHVTLAWRMR